ncbi:MAG: putative Ig domain-containing protein [Bacteroidales bacterium]|nr:putative Ig domain-containing protein [Bacteroidales bacterium]
MESPTAEGTYNVELTASNLFGENVKMLVIQITRPIDIPVITNVLTRQTTINEPFSYSLTASGTGPIEYNAYNLPAGLSFDTGTSMISGSPTVAGVYNITLTARNSGGTTTETLVLTVGTPPTITSPLTASGTADVQFSTYTFTASGSPQISYAVSNLPQGLSFDSGSRTINGTPLNPGVKEVLLTATNAYGNDAKTLEITIAEGLEAPVITSPLTASGVEEFPFSYTITATGSQPMTFSASNLPAGSIDQWKHH